MKYIVLLIMIIGWWFFVILGMNFLILDDTLAAAANPEGSANYSALDTGSINFSAESVGENTGVSQTKTALKFLFGFSVPDNVYGVPNIIRNIISFINWVVAVLTIITIIKVVNIIHGG